MSESGICGRNWPLKRTDLAMIEGEAVDAFLQLGWIIPHLGDRLPEMNWKRIPADCLREWL